MKILFSAFSFRNPEERLRKSKVEPLWFPEQKSRFIHSPRYFNSVSSPRKNRSWSYHEFKPGIMKLFPFPPWYPIRTCLAAVLPPDTCGNYFHEPADFVKKDHLLTDSQEKAFLCTEKIFFWLFCEDSGNQDPPCLDFRNRCPLHHSPPASEFFSPRKIVLPAWWSSLP